MLSLTILLENKMAKIILLKTIDLIFSLTIYYQYKLSIMHGSQCIPL